MKVDQVVERLESYCQANGIESFAFGLYNNVKKTRATSGRALAKIWKFINVMLVIFPSGHVDVGLLKTALVAVILNLESLPKKPVKVNNTKSRPTHEFVDWVVKRTVVVMYHFRRLANKKRLKTCLGKCSLDDKNTLASLLLNLKVTDDDSQAKDSQGLFSSDAEEIDTPDDDNSDGESLFEFNPDASAGPPDAASAGPPSASSAGPPAATSDGPPSAAELPLPTTDQPLEAPKQPLPNNSKLLKEAEKRAEVPIPGAKGAVKKAVISQRKKKEQGSKKEFKDWKVSIFSEKGYIQKRDKEGKFRHIVTVEKKQVERFGGLLLSMFEDIICLKGLVEKATVVSWRDKYFEDCKAVFTPKKRPAAKYNGGSTGKTKKPATTALAKLEDDMPGEDLGLKVDQGDAILCIFG